MGTQDRIGVKYISLWAHTVLTAKPTGGLSTNPLSHLFFFLPYLQALVLGGTPIHFLGPSVRPRVGLGALHAGASPGVWDHVDAVLCCSLTPHPSMDQEAAVATGDAATSSPPVHSVNSCCSCGNDPWGAEGGSACCCQFTLEAVKGEGTHRGGNHASLLCGPATATTAAAIVTASVDTAAATSAATSSVAASANTASSDSAATSSVESPADTRSTSSVAPGGWNSRSLGPLGADQALAGAEARRSTCAEAESLLATASLQSAESLAAEPSFASGIVCREGSMESAVATDEPSFASGMGWAASSAASSPTTATPFDDDSLKGRQAAHDALHQSGGLAAWSLPGRASTATATGGAGATNLPEDRWYPREGSEADEDDGNGSFTFCGSPRGLPIEPFISVPLACSRAELAEMRGELERADAARESHEEASMNRASSSRAGQAYQELCRWVTWPGVALLGGTCPDQCYNSRENVTSREGAPFTMYDPPAVT